jgi:FtsP/CotA-like multicopper oxidase with cupredoxin domain
VRVGQERQWLREESMAVIEYWIQLEVMPSWDTQPNGIDRMDGSMITNHDVLKNALVYRRCTANWAAPDDRKINPWDLNEPDPTKTGGTIPGPVLECSVGDDLLIHFRNNDTRWNDPAAKVSFGQCAHSMHPHGIVFPSEYDGAYPLSRPDASQAIDPSERNAWNMVGVTGPNKQGDRVPPGGTFMYTWRTFGWPTTAGVWLYHDHSVMDTLNTLRGAIGFLVIHNANDEDDVPVQDLPPGGPNGPLTDAANRVLATPAKAFYLQLFHELKDDSDVNSDGSFNANRGSYINGRRNLGNTPTLLGGVNTHMRFGLGAMNLLDFHTFHIHGHRWVIPGPSGTHVGGETALPGTGVQVSPLNQGVSQFEDTKALGPGNTFVLTIRQGSFMGPPLGNQKGEWHMHCHLLDHMRSDGMMGSLLITAAGDPLVLPSGTVPMSPMPMPMPGAVPGGKSSRTRSRTGRRGR